MPLRLQWSKTWPDRPEDFSCKDGEVRIGRIYSIIRGGFEKEWHWFLNGYLPDRNVQMSERGICATKQEAAEAVEAAYFRKKAEPR